MKFTEEQQAFRDSVRRVVERQVAPIAAEIDDTDRFPRELVQVFGEMGLMQLLVPEEYGGPGGDLTMMCIAREEIARATGGAPSEVRDVVERALLRTVHRLAHGPTRRLLTAAEAGDTDLVNLLGGLFDPTAAAR